MHDIETASHSRNLSGDATQCVPTFPAARESSCAYASAVDARQITLADTVLGAHVSGGLRPHRLAARRSRLLRADECGAWLRDVRMQYFKWARCTIGEIVDFSTSVI